MTALVYVRPIPQSRQKRRVYVLPTELVERIHAYGFDKGHSSEVSAVRELLEAALDARAIQREPAQ